MAGLVRKTLIPFGGSGPTSSFGQFGSKEAGFPQTSQDPAVIQGLSAWVEGWQNAIVSSDKAAYLEDMNGWCFVHSYEVAYLFQMGIPEWDAATLYFTNSIVQTASNGQWFQSLQGGVPGVGAGQSGNAPPASASNAFWLWINPPAYIVVPSAPSLNVLPKVANVSPSTGVPGSIGLANSAVAEDGTDVIISLPLKFPDGSIQSSAAVSVNAVTVASPPAAYRTVPIQPSGTSGARALGTTYQNSSSKPLFVTVSTFTQSSATTVFCDGTTSPATVVAQISSTGGPTGSQVIPITFIVLPGYWYNVIGGSLEFWTEWS